MEEQLLAGLRRVAGVTAAYIVNGRGVVEASARGGGRARGAKRDRDQPSHARRHAPPRVGARHDPRGPGARGAAQPAPRLRFPGDGGERDCALLPTARVDDLRARDRPLGAGVVRAATPVASPVARWARRTTPADGRTTEGLGPKSRPPRSSAGQPVRACDDRRSTPDGTGSVLRRSSFVGPVPAATTLPVLE